MWAVEVMPDFWAALVETGDATAIPDLPTVNPGHVLVLPLDNEDVIEDFLYRIEQQASDMAEEEATTRSASPRAPVEAITASMHRPIKSLATKIRRAAGKED
jgi:hypothetical protein